MVATGQRLGVSCCRPRTRGLLRPPPAASRGYGRPPESARCNHLLRGEPCRGSISSARAEFFGFARDRVSSAVPDSPTPVGDGSLQRVGMFPVKDFDDSPHQLFVLERFQIAIVTRHRHGRGLRATAAKTSKYDELPIAGAGSAVHDEHHGTIARVSHGLAPELLQRAIIRRYQEILISEEDSTLSSGTGFAEGAQRSVLDRMPHESKRRLLDCIRGGKLQMEGFAKSHLGGRVYARSSYHHAIVSGLLMKLSLGYCG